MLISVVSFVWSFVNLFRRKLANMGLLSVYKVKIPSILVGNLQAGGAGKTPLVIALAKEATARGMRVAVVSRGYGSTKNNPLGDEPQEILSAVPGVILSINANKLKAIHAAEKQKPDLILFDDGFQNLHFKSKVNLIVVTERSRSEVVYRDFDSEIRFADFVVGTKGAKFRDEFVKNEGKFFQILWEWDQPIVEPVWILCGIADPEELVRFYHERGLIIKKIITKPDHAEFNVVEVEELIKCAKNEGCLLAMTEKDRVKIPSLSNNIYVLKRSILNRDWMDAIFSSKLK